MNTSGSWLAANYSYLIGLTPIIIGAVILIACCIAVLRNQTTAALLGVVAFGTALCGSAVFANISWGKEEGKIETIAGALALASGASDKNRTAINGLKEALVTLRTQVDRIIAAQAASSAATGPASPKSSGNAIFCAASPELCKDGGVTSQPTFDWNSIESDLKKFDSDIGGVSNSVNSSQSKLKELNSKLQNISPDITDQWLK
ncbi:hypothetical protein [Rhizobium sp. AN80A]|uniref:hypothetical protein n=1 Tax=Rhizobium sp. AN80A TaxID=3040673 RepID=UPI0024B32A6E|nr:hypothetical protein [Rhizobium sp. AN80A]